MSDIHKVAVDLTPLTNDLGIGGERTLAIELIRRLGSADSNFEYILLTSADTHEKLAELDSRNVCRVCVKDATRISATGRIGQQLHLLVNSIFSGSIQKSIKNSYRKVFPLVKSTSLLNNIGVDLLFCPFTGPIYHTPGIPTVCIVHDLQFLKYPEYFSKIDLMYLKEHFDEACELSAQIITVSDFVKQTILENSKLKDGNISVIHNSIQSRFKTDRELSIKILDVYGLNREGYLFFPAKYWPHKNHRTALQGFKLFLRSHPRQKKKLVFSGISPQSKIDLQALVSKLGLEANVVIFGWVEEDTLAALYKFCWAVLIPSMYEGFGIPVIEGFSFEKPVLCSNVTSLPEVGGDAALYFDPTNIEDIARAISNLADHPEISTALVEKGRAQLSKFSDSQGMALQYETVFNEVLGGA